jgi:uncharacterized membrane protein YvlD (DUF360 family)
MKDMTWQRAVGRSLLIWLLGTVGLVVAALLLPGLQIENLRSAAAAVLISSVINALLWPLLSRALLPFMVYTLGLVTLLLNAVIFGAAASLLPGIHFESGWTLLGAVVIMSAITMLLSTLLTIDDEAPYYRNVILRAARRTRGAAPLAKHPGVVFLEIDGLSAPSLRKAIEQGHMPTLASWLARGSHKVTEWETDTSCQTGASQAGILLGNNADIPAFRWVDKANGNKIITSSGPKDAPQIEADHSNGQGLLAVNGASRTNLFSGDAGEVMMTYSRVTSISKLYTPSYYFFFSSPYQFIRTLILFVGEIIYEIRARRRQERENVIPRLGKEKRGGIYPMVRAFTTIFLRDLTTHTLVGDILAGTFDAEYATYFGYDEVAHHSGVEVPDAFRTLRQLDQQFARLERAAAHAERKIYLTVLSDHGQSQGRTFKQRYHLTLKDYIQSLLPAELKIHDQLETDEGWDHVSLAATDVVQNDPKLIGRTVKSQTEGSRDADGRVLLGPEAKRAKAEKKGEAVGAQEAALIVLASGNLGLVYFADSKERLTLEQINERFPELIPGLLKHEGIGFLLVHSAKDGGVVLGPRGKLYLESARVEGENPLALFPPRSAQHLKRTDSFRFVPDIVVNSFCDPQTGEGAAFEELIGYHGGMGGNQSRPFVLYPAEWKLGEGEIVGAEELHRRLKAEVAEMSRAA